MQRSANGGLWLVAWLAMGPWALAQVAERPPAPPPAAPAAPGTAAPAAAVPPSAAPAAPGPAGTSATRRPPLTLFPGLQPGTLNLARLNDAMRQMLDPLAAREPAIDRLFLTFDPQRTDLSADSLGVSAGCELNRTVWSESPSQLKFTFGAKYVPPLKGPANAVFDGEGAWETDVVAMTNHLVPILVDRLSQPPRPKLLERFQPAKNTYVAAAATPPGEPALFDPAEEFRKRLIAELSVAGPIRSFDELCDLVTKASSHRFVIQTEHIAALRRAVDAAQDPARRAELTAQLQEARVQRDRQLQVRPVVSRGSDGRAESISVSILDATMSDQLHVERLELVITPASARLAAAARLTRGVEMYALLRPVAAAVLGQLQEGRPEDIDSYRRIIENYFLQERELVLGPAPKP